MLFWKFFYYFYNILRSFYRISTIMFYTLTDFLKTLFTNHVDWIIIEFSSAWKLSDTRSNIKSIRGINVV